MRVKIDFEGSQPEFEQFCQTPQRIAHAQLLQQYQGWLQQPYPIEVEASPVTPVLPVAGQAYYQTQPLALPPSGNVPATVWGQGTTLRPAMPSGQNLGWQRWVPKLELTGPVRFFLLSLGVSAGLVAAVKLRPTMQATTPQGQFMLQPTKPTKQAAPTGQKGTMPLLPLVPRPGQE